MNVSRAQNVLTLGKTEKRIVRKTQKEFVCVGQLQIEWKSNVRGLETESECVCVWP